MKTCGACIYFKPDSQRTWFGWCASEARRIPPSEVFPNGTMPSAGSSHGKDCKHFLNWNEEPREDGGGKG